MGRASRMQSSDMKSQLCPALWKVQGVIRRRPFPAFVYVVLPICSSAPTTPLAFLHIPKNGGTSLNRYLFSNWDASCDQFHLRGHGIEQLAANIRQWPRGGGSSCRWVHVHVGGIGSTRELFKELSTCHGLRPRYLSGHMDFGTCNYMQAGCEYVTVFRDPMSRMLSHYKYLKKRHPELIAEYCASLQGGCPTFADYVDAVHKGKVWFYGAANHQTLFMAGNEYFRERPVCGEEAGFVEVDRSPELGFSNGRQYDPRLVQVAKDHLALRTPVFGFLDDLGTFQAQMERHYGYRRMPMPMLNQAPGEDLADLDADTLAKMRDIQRMDIELLSYAKELLAQRLQAMNVTSSTAARTKPRMLPSRLGAIIRTRRGRRFSIKSSRTTMSVRPKRLHISRLRGTH